MNVIREGTFQPLNKHFLNLVSIVPAPMRIIAAKALRCTTVPMHESRQMDIRPRADCQWVQKGLQCFSHDASSGFLITHSQGSAVPE